MGDENRITSVERVEKFVCKRANQIRFSLIYLAHTLILHRIRTQAHTHILYTQHYIAFTLLAKHKYRLTVRVEGRPKKVSTNNMAPNNRV